MRRRRIAALVAIRLLAAEQAHTGRSWLAAYQGVQASKAGRLRAQRASLDIPAQRRDEDLAARHDGEPVTMVVLRQGQVAADAAALLPQASAPAAVDPPRFQAGSGFRLLLLLYFFSGVTNVNWASPFSAALVFAVLLAAMVTGISFAFFRFTGDRLQQYKNDTGVIPLRGLDEATTVSMGLALGAMVILAALMFVRMRAEVLDALGPHASGTAIIIRLALALVSILANTLVIAVHALDGSAEADRLDALGRAMYHPLPGSITCSSRQRSSTSRSPSSAGKPAGAAAEGIAAGPARFVVAFANRHATDRVLSANHPSSLAPGHVSATPDQGAIPRLRPRHQARSAAISGTLDPGD